MSGLISKSCPCGFVVSRKRGNLRKLDSVYSWLEGRLAAHEANCAGPAMYALLTRFAALAVPPLERGTPNPDDVLAARALVARVRGTP